MNKEHSNRFAACFATGALTALVAILLNAGVVGTLLAWAVGAAVGYVSYRPGDVLGAVREYMPAAAKEAWRLLTSPFTYASVYVGVVTIWPVSSIAVGMYVVEPMLADRDPTAGVYLAMMAVLVIGAALGWYVGMMTIDEWTPDFERCPPYDGVPLGELPIDARVRTWQHRTARRTPVAHFMDRRDEIVTLSTAFHRIDSAWMETFTFVTRIVVVPVLRWWFVSMPMAVFSEVAGFVRNVFRAIHCQERVSRAIDGPLGGVVAYLVVAQWHGPAFHEIGVLPKLGVILTGGALGLAFAVIGHEVARRNWPEQQSA